MIKRNEIPVLEFDDFSIEVISPNHDNPFLRLPKKCVFAFLGEIVDEYAISFHARIAEEFVTVSKTFHIYVLNYKGEDICLVQSPTGAATAAQLIDVLIAHGCNQIIAVGSCGVLADLPENTFWFRRKRSVTKECHINIFRLLGISS